MPLSFFKEVIMEILKIAVLLVTLGTFVFTALVMREDSANDHKWATILFCLSMAALVTVKW